MRTVVWTLVLFLYGHFSYAASCTFVTNVPSISYTVAETNPSVPATLSIDSTGSNANECRNYFLAFTKGWAGNYNRRATNIFNGALIYYNLYKFSNSTGILKEASDITSSNETLMGPIEKNNPPIVHTYYFTLAAINNSSPPRAGNYIDIVEVQAYAGFYNNIVSYEGSKNLYVNIHVPTFISLSLVNTGAVYDPSQVSKVLDFGELEQNDELSFDVRIASNVGYILRASSQNNGKLIRTGGTGVNSEVSYSFYANNSLKSLANSSASPVNIGSAVGITPAGGAVVPVRVMIGSVTNKDSGNYSDYITLSVISNN